MKAISITAMIFAVAVAFAVGWLTGSHAGYTAGAESEHVLIDARATLPVLSWQGASFINCCYAALASDDCRIVR